MIRLKDVVVILFLSALLAFFGCGIKRYGNAATSAFGFSAPELLDGQSKKNIIKELGAPDYQVAFDDKEYWGYKNKRGWSWNYYIYFGKTEDKDLILQFTGDTVSSQYLIDKGSSVGIFVPPYVIAN